MCIRDSIGAVVRSVTFDGIKYYWHEYLLYNPMVGFRWLVPVSYTHLRAHETVLDLVCRLLL